MNTTLRSAVGLVALLVGQWALPAPGAAQDTARGVVYLDANRNQARDAGEPGLEGISVSNGRDVVQTGAEGRYELPVHEGDILFVTKPAGYMVPVDEDNLPQFYYLHDPDGTPDSLNVRFPGVAPTGPLPAAVNFPLYEQGVGSDFTAVAFADPQAADDEELRFVRDDVVNELIGTDAAFGITVGDVVNDDLALYPRHNRIVGRVGIPWWNLPGNHDMNYEAPSDAYATETYKRYFGPTNYSFAYGDVHFIMLDNVEYAGKGKTFPYSGAYRGFLTKEQLEWIEADLRTVPKERRIVIATHIPLRTYAVGDTSASWLPGTDNLKQLLGVLDGYKVYSISGHDTSNSWHVYLNEDDGWGGEEAFHHHVLAEVRGGGWAGPRDVRGVRAAPMADGTPNGYYFLDFDGEAYNARFKPAHLPPGRQMRITAYQPAAQHEQLHAGQWAAPQLFVNVFDGGPRTTVRYQVGGREPVRMKRVIAADPFMERLHARLEGTPDAVAAPEPSSHLWTAPLPQDLPAGAHAVTVTATNEFDVRHEAAVALEIAPAASVQDRVND
jgi:hypothetical protein